MNTQVTINFYQLGVENDHAGGIFSELRSRVSRWWAYERSKGRNIGSFTDVHSHANPAGSRHVHWMVYVPAEVADAFAETVAARLRKITHVAELGSALDIDNVDTPGSTAKYHLRGIDPQYADYLHIDAADEGIVLGRRTGTSRAVSLSARKRAGWRRKRPRSWPQK